MEPLRRVFFLLGVLAFSPSLKAQITVNQVYGSCRTVAATIGFGPGQPDFKESSTGAAAPASSKYSYSGGNGSIVASATASESASLSAGMNLRMSGHLTAQSEANTTFYGATGQGSAHYIVNFTPASDIQWFGAQKVNSAGDGTIQYGTYLQKDGGGLALGVGVGTLNAGHQYTLSVILDVDSSVDLRFGRQISHQSAEGSVSFDFHTAPNTCDDVLGLGAVQFALTPDGRGMEGTFRPNYSYTLSQAAAICGLDHFNWVQWVIYDDDPNRPADCLGNVPHVPYLDPPLCGYAYQPSGDDYKLGYWNEDSGELASHTTGSSLDFIDKPGTTASSRVRFRTSLVGLDSSGHIILKGDVFSWESSSTGVSVRKNVDASILQNGNVTLMGRSDPALLPFSEHRFLKEQGIDVPFARPICGGITFNGATVNLSVSNLVERATNYVDLSQDFATWSNLGSFVSSGFQTNWSKTATNWSGSSFFRIRTPD
jgi:hypothetical protein